VYFYFNMFNHSDLGQRSLEDVIGILGHQLRALGHQAIWDPKNSSFALGDVINVVVEGFTPPVIEAMATARAQGARFLILATEEPTPRGFNHGTQKEMVYRQTTFPEAAKHVEGIIHLVPGQHVTDWYAQFAPAAYTELGYSPKIVRPVLVREPEYDFGFFGSITKRRMNILKRLAGKTINTTKAVFFEGTLPAQEVRDKQMANCKVIVQLRKFEAMGLVSSSRCNTALCVGRPIVAEPHDLSKPWDEIISMAETMEGFYTMCLMAKINWRELHRKQMAVFMDRLSPEKCVGRALEQLGIVERAAA